MCVPLLSQDRKPLGVLQLDTRKGRDAFNVDDLEILATVAVQVASAVEYARLHQELLALHTVQQEMELASVRPRNAPVAAFCRGDGRQSEAEDDPRGEKAGGSGKRH
jgi:GAF domain-containing protein